MHLYTLIKALAAAIILIGLAFYCGYSLQEQAAVEGYPGLTKDQMAAEADKMVESAAGTPDQKISLAEALIQSDPSKDAVALYLLRSALEDDPKRPFALALIAFSQSRLAETFTPDAEAALRESIAICPFCNRDLLKWRLEYVLANWIDVPDDLRLQVFEGADFLRWWHLEYDYLKRTRNLAEAEGIPFAFYQKRIDTPVRPNEIGRR